MRSSDSLSSLRNHSHYRRFELRNIDGAVYLNYKESAKDEDPWRCSWDIQAADHPVLLAITSPPGSPAVVKPISDDDSSANAARIASGTAGLVMTLEQRRWFEAFAAHRDSAAAHPMVRAPPPECLSILEQRAAQLPPPPRLSPLVPKEPPPPIASSLDIAAHKYSVAQFRYRFPAEVIAGEFVLMRSPSRRDLWLGRAKEPITPTHLQVRWYYPPRGHTLQRTWEKSDESDKCLRAAIILHKLPLIPREKQAFLPPELLAVVKEALAADQHK